MEEIKEERQPSLPLMRPENFEPEEVTDGAVWNETLKSCVLARLANPSSKRMTAALLERDFGIRIPLNRIYRLMDHVTKHEELIRQQVKLYESISRRVANTIFRCNDIVL